MDNNTFQFTIRLYDKEEIDRVKNTYKECKVAYKRRNTFLTECLKRGLDVMESDLLGAKTIVDISKLYEEIRKTTEKLTKLIEMSEQATKDNYVNAVVNQRLLSCNYNLLLGLTTNNKRDEQDINDGLLDGLPLRIEELIEEILQHYRK